MIIMVENGTSMVYFNVINIMINITTKNSKEIDDNHDISHNSINMSRIYPTGKRLRKLCKKLQE